MMSIKPGTAQKSLITFLVVAVLWTLCLADTASAQRVARRSSGTIDAGTNITVRTNEAIDSDDNDGRVYSASVEQDVTDRNGSIAIPKGSDVELVVKRASNSELTVDLDSLTVNGQRYGVEVDENVVRSERREGLGANERTGKYVGGGAVLGAIIGAIAGGGKGAAIGAGAGAAAGAGTQVLTRGKSVYVPSESLLTFRLSEPIRAPIADSGYMRNGVHYHNGYGNDATVNNNQAYEAGLRAGRLDRERGASRNLNSRWTNPNDRRDYETGYNQGYDQGRSYNNGR
jgi:hypothetical protein